MLSAKPWRREMVIWFCAAQLASLGLGLAMIGLLQKAGFTAFQPPAGSGAVLVGTLAFQGATWVLIPFFLRQHQVNWRDAFGLRQAELTRAWFPAVGAVCLFLPVAWLLQYVSIDTLTRIGWPPENEAAVMVLTGARTWWLRGYLCLFTVAIGPVAEEFIFRGMLYPFVKQCGWPRLAWFGVSFVFALIHWDAAAFVPLFLLALVLTWLYERTGSLLAPILAHALFNAVNLVLLCWFQHELKPGPS
ncbi:MAG: type II CAAX endopeptidase family protein [Verrucomicrobiia bacterium]